ncbi:hypothetical protein [Micromonospora sp. DT233]|uniref:hypothetical protein n=1 Tax=Micromonospora sp. DT233 TaxID=3393432 RepID=UPI003CF4DBDE
MQPGPLPAADPSDDPAGPPRCAPTPLRVGVTEPGPDDPLGVVAVGPAGAARREVLADLLGLAPQLLVVPAGSWLLLSHAKVSTRAAYVPGYRQPHSYAPDRPGTGPALARPPRRVELAVAEPLLRHFAVVDTPDTDTLGTAGGRLLRDAVGRAGALLFVIAADQALSAAELKLLAEVADSAVEVFFVVTPGGTGWAAPPGGAPPDGAAAVPDPAAVAPDPAAVAGGPAGTVEPVELVLAAHRATLLAAVPALVDAPWYRARPGDPGALRRALVGWAAEEGLRRSSAQSPVLPGWHGRVPVSARADDRGWQRLLDRQTRCCAQRIRQDLALELAKAHLRAVQEVVFGAGPASLPQLLDRELEALSVLATAQCDAAVRGIVDDVAGRVLETPVPLPEGLRRRIDRAVRWEITDGSVAQELDRVLLVTSAAGVTEVTGAGAMDPLSSYPRGERFEVLTPVGVALSGGCWQRWNSPGGLADDDQGGARNWAQRALREVELELTREVSRRFEAVRLALGTVLAEAVDHGTLRA